MAMLQRVRLLANERLDLNDFNNLQSFTCADFAAMGKYVWTPENYVFSGFEATGVASSTLSVGVATAAAVIGQDEGIMYIGAPSLPDITTTALTPGSVNYVEVFIDQDTGGADSRSFWDPAAAGGAGGEFSQTVDTYIFQKASFSINTSSFTGDANALPIAEVTVDGGGLITAIKDARPLFFRLGRPGDAAFSFSWTYGRTAETSGAPTYTDPDKAVKSLKSMFDALMDSVREIKGTTYWYEAPFTSLLGNFQNVGLSVLTGTSLTANFAWDGSDLSITDGSPSGTPDDDVVAYLRLFNSSVDLELTRQDASSTKLSLSDGDVLWVEIPDPLANQAYSGSGASLANYRTSPRGSVPLNDKTYWLAFREGTRLYLRGLGELEAGESRNISDETTTALSTFLGFDPETATTVPYTATPVNATLNSFTTSSPLLTAISANTANIDTTITHLNSKATPPLEMTESVTPDLTVNVGSNFLQDSELDYWRTHRPIANLLPEITGESVTFPASSGGSTTNTTSGTDITITISSGNFLKVGISLNSSGDFVLNTGAEGASIAAATAPAQLLDTYPIGYVVLENVAGTIQDIVNSRMYHYIDGWTSAAGVASGLETTDASNGSVVVVAGNTRFHPYLEIQAADTYTINGRLLVVDALTVDGTLTVPAGGTVVTQSI